MKIRKQQNGFSLLELMLAAFILSIVVTGLVQLFITCRYLNESNQNLVAAASHAQFIMEEIRGSSGVISTIETAVQEGAWNLTSDALQDAPYEFDALANESVTAEVFQTGNPLGITVTVRWRQGSMIDHDYSLQTLVSQ